MPIRECNKRAIKKYRAKSVTRHYVELYPTDSDIKNKLQELKSENIGFQTYVKLLIRKDIAENDR